MFWATVIHAEDARHVRSWGASVEACADAFEDDSFVECD